MFIGSRVALLAVAAFSLAMATATTVEAQGKAQTRKGFWITGGLGGGSLGCDDCEGRESGATAQIALGGTLTPRFQLGATSNAWSKSVDGVTISQSGLMALAKFYPSATGGFFLQGGLGVGRFEVGDDSLTEGITGTSAILGIGYDWRVGKNFSVTPFFNGIGGSFDEGSANFNQLGISLTWH
ncbi:hypothetical protein [Gemmatimonas sp.]|jgi:hypothetical protein|uniref:hypothetical protein n=1 Tax=Gemmatimonas sp. TaxID=1962908 RepID=UPI0037BEF9D3